MVIYFKPRAENVLTTFDVMICGKLIANQLFFFATWLVQAEEFIIYCLISFFFRVLSFSSSSLGTFESSPSPRYTWSDHALPVTDIHCGHGGMRAHVITSSLDQTCKVLVQRGYQVLARKYLANINPDFMVAFAFLECHALCLELLWRDSVSLTPWFNVRAVSRIVGIWVFCLVSSKT